MAGIWNMEGMSSALPETATTTSIDGNPFTDASASAEALRAKAREHNWAPTTTYDYDALTATGPGGGDGAVPWASSSQRYEWKDEYGDVGPPVPELEEALFHSEDVNRAGIRFEELETVNITAEGPKHFAPIRSVSLTL